MNIKRLLTFIIVLIGLLGQAQNTEKTARQYINAAASSWGLSNTDISDLTITDQYKTSHNGVEHFYFNQRVNGIPIYNAITSVHIDKNGKAHGTNHRFLKNVSKRINSSSPTLPISKILGSAITYLNIQDAIIPNVIETREKATSYTFENTNFSNSPVHADLCYVQNAKGDLVLSWNLAIDQKDNADYWSLRVDAQTGDIVNKNNYTTYCNFGHHSNRNNTRVKKRKSIGYKATTDEAMILGAASQYRVYKLPAESPIHGIDELVVDPYDSLSSPMGWHSVGSKDFTITRGNNVHAYLDITASNNPSEPEPDGGADHIFDFAYDHSLEPNDVNNKPAAVTNLFYMNNMIHDILYVFGFDEVAGNFQTNNWNKGGRQNDEVKAEAQDGSGQNNANFSTPPDGGRGRMQMFLWTNSSQSAFYITGPDDVEGGIDAIRAGFGPDVPDVPIEAEMVIADDGSRQNPSRACNDNLKKEDVEGKIVMIDRGTCEFSSKTLYAQNAGAVAVLVCFFDEANFSMGAGVDAGKVTIPAFSATKSVCDKLKVHVGNGLRAKIEKPKGGGPSALDGDLDNGIIAHEFGHGISNRLTGGPNAAGCLGNEEQMGEGWSDFFSLVLTVQPGDKGEDARGIGNFAIGAKPNGPGIRPLPYSTDMNINNHTYFSARTLSVPHGVGAVWCAMIWDLYWALVDEYGYSEDFRDPNAGNNIAIQLVVDGLKLQACNPGFIDGRDAILEADTLNNGGVNSCLIWEVFARRGLGYGASQGTSQTIGDKDERESYDSPPTCQDRLRIAKSVTTFIKAGDDIDVTLDIANNRNEVTTNVTVTDIIPDRCSYIMGSSAVEPIIDGNKLTWNIGDMEPITSQTITYQLSTDATHFSTLSWEEVVEDDITPFDTWLDDDVKGSDAWDISEDFYSSPDYSWFVNNGPEDNDQHLYLINSLKLDQDHPVIRFDHLYNTQINGGIAAGTVELSVNDGPWKIAKDKFILNGFDGAVPYGTFVEPLYAGFYGNSKGFKTSYVDLLEYKGEDIKIKFRFGSSANTTEFNSDTTGWAVDDIQLINMISYNSEACINGEAFTGECVSAAGQGTIVEVDIPISNEDPLQDVKFRVYPTPASDNVLIDLKGINDFEGILTMIDINGKILKTLNVEKTNKVSVQWNVSELPSGIYMVQLQSDQNTISHKVVVKQKN